jgi:hypothetical protein
LGVNWHRSGGWPYAEPMHQAWETSLSLCVRWRPGRPASCWEWGREQRAWTGVALQSSQAKYKLHPTASHKGGWTPIGLCTSTRDTAIWGQQDGPVEPGTQSTRVWGSVIRFTVSIFWRLCGSIWSSHDRGYEGYGLVDHHQHLRERSFVCLQPAIKKEAADSSEVLLPHTSLHGIGAHAVIWETESSVFGFSNWCSLECLISTIHVTWPPNLTFVTSSLFGQDTVIYEEVCLRGAMLCSSLKVSRCRGTCLVCLIYLQGWREAKQVTSRSRLCFLPASSLAFPLILKTGSMFLWINQATWCYVPEYRSVHSHSCENSNPKQTPWLLVYKRTILAERPLIVEEI